MHVTSRLFNRFEFFLIQFSCATTIVQAWTLPLNQLFAIIAFNSQFKSLSVSLSQVNIKKSKHWQKSIFNFVSSGKFSEMDAGTTA